MEDSTKHIHVKIEMENFATTYQEFETKFKKYVAIFKGSIDPITKINWCSDCVLIEEPIKNFFIPLAQEKNIAVLEVRCGQREEYIFIYFKNKIEN